VAEVAVAEGRTDCGAGVGVESDGVGEESVVVAGGRVEAPALSVGGTAEEAGSWSAEHAVKVMATAASTIRLNACGFAWRPSMSH
jgi:hypothetical protein